MSYDQKAEIWECSACGTNCIVKIELNVHKRPANSEQEPPRFIHEYSCICGLSRRVQWIRRK